MNQLSTYSWTFDEDVLRYAEAGYRAMGVWRSKLSDFGEERGIELLRETGMAVSNLMWAGGFTGCDGRSFNESVEDGMEAIRLAAQLAAESVVVYTGSRFGHTRNHARRLSRRAIDRLLPIAEQMGVTLAVAPIHRDSGGEWTFLHSLADLLQFVNQFHSPIVKIVFDTYQLGQCEPNFEQISETANQVAVVHLADARKPPAGEVNCCLLNEGKLPNRAMLAALQEGGFTGYSDIKLMGEDVELHDYEYVLEQSLEAVAQLERGETRRS